MVLGFVFWLVLACSFFFSDCQSAGGEAWSLSTLEDGDSVPLLMKVTTSGRASYDKLVEDLGLRLRILNSSTVAFEVGLSRCGDVLLEAKGLPAPKACSTSADGSELQLAFHRDQALRPSTTYFFTVHVRLLSSVSTERQRTIFVETFEGYLEIDTFGFVLPNPAEAVSGPQLRVFEIAVASTSPLTNGEHFALSVTLATSGGAASVNSGLGDTVMIWAMPLSLWDFAAASPCIVEITATAGAGAGSCVFRRFPADGGPEVEGAFGLNAVELTPTEQVGATPLTFTLRLVSPTAGGVLTDQHHWYAQARRSGRPSQQLLAAPQGPEVVLHPTAAVARVSNAAAGAQNEVDVVFTPGATFRGQGEVRIQMPESFAVYAAEAAVFGYSRLGGSGASQVVVVVVGSTIALQLPSSGALLGDAYYAVRILVRNPNMATFPTACATALAPLAEEEALLQQLSAEPFATGTPELWMLQVDVGFPSVLAGSTSFQAFNVLPPPRGANLAPTHQEVGNSDNVLTVFFRLTVGLLTSDVEVELGGPSEFRFLCSELLAPAVPFTSFPTIDSCESFPGLLTLSLAPDQYHPFDDPLSFSIAVQNPTESEARALERTAQLVEDPSFAPLDEVQAAMEAQRSWALQVKVRSVVCQSQVEMSSPYRTDTWRIFQRALTMETLSSTNRLPDSSTFVIITYRLTQLLASGSTITLRAPYGFRFLADIQVDALSTGAEEDFPAQLPIQPDAAIPHQLTFTMSGSARASVLYGFRSEIQTSPVSPTTQEQPSANIWSMAAATTAQADEYSDRAEAGTFHGFQITALQGCRVEPTDVVAGHSNEVTISFVAHRSMYSTGTVVGTIQVAVPHGFVVPSNCVVKEPKPTMELPQTTIAFDTFRFFGVSQCQGNGNRAIISIDQATAIVQGSHIRFRLEVINSETEPVSNFWGVATAQGTDVLEECERDAPGFVPLRALEIASYAVGSVGEDLRPGQRSVYRIAFMYPERTSDEALEIHLGTKTRSSIRVTVPDGFQTLAACLTGASGAAGYLDGQEVVSLPSLVACVGIGRVADFTLADLIQPETLYALSMSVVNPSTNFPYVASEASWLLEVDGAAAGDIDAPAVRLLQEVWVRLGDARALSPSQWAKMHFRTATDVPQGGGLSMLMPFPFQVPSCEEGSWGLYDASHEELGGDAVAVGTGCSVVQAISSGQQHRILLYPLTEQLNANQQYLFTVLIGNGDLASHAADPSGWSLSSMDAEGEAIDLSPTVTSPTITRDFGSLSFGPPALSVPAGESYGVTVEFALRLPARRGAVVFSPPPTVRVGCPQASDFALTELPPEASCSVIGSFDTWSGQQLVFRSLYNPWASTRPYHFRMQVYNTDGELPVYRRNWAIELIEGLPEDSDVLTGFVIGSRSMEQWRWRGQLQHLQVSSDYPALNRRSTTLVHFAVVLPLSEPNAELWVRPPAQVRAHASDCRWSHWVFEDATAEEEAAMLAESLGALVPVLCDVPLHSDDPCTPAVWETQPCGDTTPDALPSSHGFAHRQGLRVVTGTLEAGSYVSLSFATTPELVADGVAGATSGNVWTVSTWQGDVEQDVAQAPGYAIRNWIDVIRFEPSSLLPEVDVDIRIEWWMLISLEAKGRVAVLAPASGSLLFDLSSTAERFHPGNLPGGEHSTSHSSYPVVEVFTTSLEVSLCCMLSARTRYHLQFGSRNPPFAQMPPPSAPELNTWTLLTRAPSPSQEIVHQQMVEGYRLSKSFQMAQVSLHTEVEVGGVGTANLEGKVQVSVEFMLPFATAIHGPSAELRLLAPHGWEFPVVCSLTGVRLGPYTGIGNCRASGSELVLSVVGSVNPGIENMVFGFVAAVQPPVSTPLQDVWYFQAFAPVGSQEGLYMSAAETNPEGGEVELRLTSPALGMARPSESGAFDPSGAGVAGEVVGLVEMVPRLPEALWESYRTPAHMLATVSLMMPASLSPGLANATLRLTAPSRYELRCAIPPDSFQSGTLPPGILCFDSQNADFGTSGLMLVDAPYEIALSVDNLISLQPLALYNFSVYVNPAPVDFTRPPEHTSRRSSSWAAALEAGGEQFRSVAVAAEGVEGEVQAPSAIRDFGLLTSSTGSNTLAEVSLLFSVNMRLRLPLALEVVPPLNFRFDSAPSPLHPALQPAQGGMNPFSYEPWQERAQGEAELFVEQIASGEELFGIPCPFFQMTATDPAKQEVAMLPGAINGTICESPPTLDKSLLAPCAEDTYVPLPTEHMRCSVYARKAVVKVHQRPLEEYESAEERDMEPCSQTYCVPDFLPNWLRTAQYRLTLRGYNPPTNPPSGEDMWVLTIMREAAALGGGPRNAVLPVASGMAPNYFIDAAQSDSYRVSPEGGEVIRGGSSWVDTGLGAGGGVPSVLAPATDATQDGRVVHFSPD